MENNKRLLEVEHHCQLELCKTRPAYRQGRELTAVKTYTISSESPHLFIYGVHQINLRSELKKLCSNYGQVLSINVMENYRTEMFTECYHVRFQRIQSARIAKKFLDNRSFYGSCLHVCYAPEFETSDETKQKLRQRTKDVMNRLYPSNKNNLTFSNSNINSHNKSVGNSTNMPVDPILIPNFSKPQKPQNTSSSNNSETIVQLLENLPQTSDFQTVDDSASAYKSYPKRVIEIPSYYLKDSEGCYDSSNQTYVVKRKQTFVPRQVMKKKKQV